MHHDLLTRLSTAPCGSRELDAEVALALGYERYTQQRALAPQTWWFTPVYREALSDPPPLTMSLDVIVDEVKRRFPGCVLTLSTMHNGVRGGYARMVWVSSPVLSTFDRDAEAIPTPKHRLDLPRAACIVLLTAVSAMETAHAK